MKLKKVLAVALAGVLTLGALSGCGTDKSASGDTGNDTSGKPLAGKHFTVAMSASFKNFETVTVDDSGKEVYEGLDIDFLDQMAEDMGFTYEISNMQFSGLIGALQSGRADFVLSGLTATDERRKSVDFSIGYIESRDAFLVSKDSGIKTVEDLNGKKIACSTGTSYETTARKVPGAIVTTFDGQPAVLAELKSGRVDAMCTDGSLLQGFINDNPDLDGFMIPKDSEINKDVDKEFAIAFPKGSDLIEAFNTEIKALQDSGKMDEIVTKWLGEAYIGE